MKFTVFLALMLVVPAVSLNDEGWIEIYAPAVAQSESGLFGVLSTMSVRVEKGRGRVFVDTFPLTEIDMQSSARMAANVASSISNKNMNDYDFFVVVRSDAQIVGGTSAGGVLTVAMTAALNGLSISEDVMMTGTINPDGSIGPVGGLPQKMEAAAGAGSKTFLIPYGQTDYTYYETTAKDLGPIVISSQNEKHVNLAERGEELGVIVREVSDIREAAREFTGVSFEVPPVEELKTENYIGLMAPQAENLAEEARKNYNIALRVESSQLQDYKNASYKTLMNGYDLLARKSYYPAISSFFESMIYSGYVLNYGRYLGEGAYESLMKDLGEDIESACKRIEMEVKLYDTMAIQCFGAAEERIYEAKKSFESAYSLLENGSISDGLFELTYALERSHSAEWWLDVAGNLELRGTQMDEESTASLALSAMDGAQESLIYAQMSASQNTLPLIRASEINLEMAGDAMSSGYTAGSIILASKAQALSELALEIGIRDLEEILGNTRKNAREAVARAQSSGIEPFLALAYLEYGDAYRDTDPFRAIQNYKYAQAIGRMSGYMTQ